VAPDDMWYLQVTYVPNEDILKKILSMWLYWDDQPIVRSLCDLGHG
jgi:hypothetical protein